MAYTVLHPDLLQAQYDEGQCDEQMQGMVADFDAAASWPDHAQPPAPAQSTPRVTADAKRGVHSSGEGEVHSNSNRCVCSAMSAWKGVFLAVLLCKMASLFQVVFSQFQCVYNSEAAVLHNLCM